jgi:hypothetical protein
MKKEGCPLHGDVQEYDAIWEMDRCEFLAVMW